MRHDSRDWPGRSFMSPISPRSPWPWVLGLVVAVFLLVAIPYAFRARQRWEAWCQGQGGTVSSHTTWRTVPGYYDRQNRYHSSTTDWDTTYYCIDSGGRLLGVR